MAIVINGSGTVTGLAVGGLPDGTVDAGTLATNSVDSAELIDGAVDDSHIGALAASKLTGALPAISGASLTGITTGKVLQIVGTTTTAQNSSTNQNLDTYSDIGLSVNITPLSSSSRFLITCTIGRGTSGASNSWGGVLFRDSSKIGNGANVGSRKGAFLMGVKNWNADQNHGFGAMNSYFNTTTGTAGTQITFKVGGVVESGTMNINRNGNFSDGAQAYNSTTSSTITVMEVEA